MYLRDVIHCIQLKQLYAFAVVVLITEEAFSAPKRLYNGQYIEGEAADKVLHVCKVLFTCRWQIDTLLRLWWM